MITFRATKMVVMLLIGVWVARYLGPSSFGVLSFGIAWVSLFSIFSRLGLQNIVVREIVANPDETPSIVGSAFALRLVGGFLCVLLAAGIYAIFYQNTDSTQLAVILVVGIAQVFLAGEVFEYWFQSQIQWKYVFIARTAALLASGGARVVFILLDFSVLWIAAGTVVEAVLLFALLYALYRRQTSSGYRWKVKLKKAAELLHYSWPVLLSSIAVVIYMRIDQVMIGSMLQSSDVGTYSAAVRVSEAWYMIPAAVIQSLSPKIIDARKKDHKLYEKRIVQLLATVIWFSIAAAVIMTIIGPTVIRVAFGEAYEGAASVLQVHFWAGAFVAMGGAIGQWFLAEHLLKIKLYRTICGAVTNLGMNFVLIPLFGILGAAIATIISQAVADYFSTLFFKRSLPAVRLLNRGILYPAELVFGWYRTRGHGAQH